MSTEQPAHSIHWLSNKGCAGKPDIIAFFNIAYTVLQVKLKTKGTYHSLWQKMI